MGTKKIQKIFYFSTKQIKDFLERKIEKKAEEERRSATTLIEEILVNHFLPENEYARKITLNYLYNENIENGVKKTLGVLFCNNISGLYFHSVYKNFKPLAIFCRDNCLQEPPCEQNNGDFAFFRENLTSVMNKLDKCVASCVETKERAMYEQHLDMAKLLITKTKENPQNVSVCEFFYFICDFWEALDDWSGTYKYLMAATRLCSFKEDEETKDVLCEILKKISKEW